MKKNFFVEEYIENHSNYKETLILLRAIMLSSELEEHIKWNAPVYSINKKNVLSIAAFNNHFGIWFFNGVFLKDKQKLLRNAQDGKAKVMRLMRFESVKDINKSIVQAYVLEAIQNQKIGKKLKPDHTQKKVIIQIEFQEVLESNNALEASFESLPNSKQREYCEYMQSAKREATKQERLNKIIPMITDSKGLHDKYKNC